LVLILSTYKYYFYSVLIASLINRRRPYSPLIIRPRFMNFIFYNFHNANFHNFHNTFCWFFLLLNAEVIIRIVFRFYKCFNCVQLALLFCMQNIMIGADQSATFQVITRLVEVLKILSSCSKI